MGSRSYIFAAILTGLSFTPALAQAQGTYYTPQSLLKDFFKTSQRVTFIELDAASIAAAFHSQLGYAPPKQKYTVFIAQTDTRIDGYAVLDDETGQHLPISFAVKISPDGKVERTEVMAYREAYGSEIRERRFQQQFVGKAATDPLRMGSDVVAISGATISSRSMATAIRRAVALVNIYRKTQ